MSCGGALYNPLLGIIGYVLHYHIPPGIQWWGAPISHFGIRYAYLLVVFTGMGIILNRKKLRFGDKLLTRHEWLFIIFVATVWLSHWVGLPVERSPDSVVDPPEIKMTKILIFVLFMTHVVTTLKRISIVLWAIVFGVLFLGYKTYTAPSSLFFYARLEGIGGSDFRESNDLAAHFVACLPIIAIQFVRSGWAGRLLATVTGVLVVNGMLLTRSRGGFVALIGSMLLAVLMASKEIRKIVIAGLVVIGIGGFFLTDQGFWKRTQTITTDEGERDRSAQGRIDIWIASTKMFQDYPFGVGTGNFVKSIAPYNPGRREADAHNTYVKCYSELGLQGMIVYGFLIFSAISLLRRLGKESQNLPPEPRKALMWLSYALMVSLSAYLFSGLTLSRLYAEGANWFLVAIPVCLWRAAQNARTDTEQPVGSWEHMDSRDSQEGSSGFSARQED